MKLLKNHTHIYGFEDYNIVALGDYCFCNNYRFNIPYGFHNYPGNYIINRDLPVRVYSKPNPSYSWISYTEFEPELAVNHKELLANAKKVFTHPSCKLSRSMMGEKYKKRYLKYFRDPEIREFNMQHEQWLFGGKQFREPVLRAVDEFMGIA